MPELSWTGTKERGPRPEPACRRCSRAEKAAWSLVPGSPEESTLVDKITDGEMPPKAALPREQVETIRAWVKSGAHYGSEPLEPPRAPRLVVAATDPSGDRAASSAGRLGLDQKSDRCVHSCPLSAKRARSGARGRSRGRLFRRLSFDLTGLPPAPGSRRAVRRRPRSPCLRGAR